MKALAKIKILMCGPGAVEHRWWGIRLSMRLGLGLDRDLAASWRAANLLKQFLQDRLDLARRWHQALTSLNENVRESGTLITSLIYFLSS